MSNFLRIFLIILILPIISSCNNEDQNPSDFIPEDTKTGTLRILFTVPEFNLLENIFVHRANLCVAFSPDSLYMNKYIDCANVSDMQEEYEFRLAPGDYFYQAAITCSAPGDSCLWGGFPGGQMGLKWTIKHVTIETNKVTESSPTFQ